MLKVDISDLEKLDAFALKIAKQISSDQCIITLEGDLGAGKTTFCQHLLKHLGVKVHIPSPSYTIINEYQTKDHCIIHADFYRLDSEDSLDLLGWDILQQKANIILIEWPKDLIDDTPNIELQFKLDTQRTITVKYK